MNSSIPSTALGGPPFSTHWALFLDMDGTLVAIARRPDEVVIEPRLLRILTALTRATAGATAIVSGRAITDIDHLLAPLELPTAGQHGAERRDASGHLHQDTTQHDALAAIRPRLADFAASQPGLMLEDKGASLSLHYRGAPHKQEAAQRALEDALASLGGDFTLRHGKQVVELRPAHSDKGDAIAAFMSEPPFAGRRPVFIGDDVTDEDGFETANRLGGYSIKVGTGATAARWRLSGTHDVLDWLMRYVQWAQRGQGPEDEL